MDIVSSDIGIEVSQLGVSVSHIIDPGVPTCWSCSATVVVVNTESRLAPVKSGGTSARTKKYQTGRECLENRQESFETQCTSQNYSVTLEDCERILDSNDD